MAYALRKLSSFVGTQPCDTVFVENATSGVETVIRSLQLKPTDSILYLDIGYGPLIKFLKFFSQTTGVELIEVISEYPLKIENIISQISACIKPNTKLALIDHITSASALILPLKIIIPLLQKKGIFVCIDGAHTVGQIDLIVPEYNADAYISNCHKWLFSSKGCAFLWVNPKHKNKIHPLVISSGSSLGMNAEFNWVGTKDYTSFLSVITAIDFYNDLGPEKIKKHNHNLALSAAIKLIQMWDTELILNANYKDLNSWEHYIGSMVTIRMPKIKNPSQKKAEEIRINLLLNYSIDTTCYCIGENMYLRISAQIYLNMDDFIKLGNSILDYLQIQ